MASHDENADVDLSVLNASLNIDALLEDHCAPISSKYEGRLIIQKMVLENFKSHGGLKEIGPFHTSMSAVVGPNGSGKSNVIDAFLFVLGKRATKLRLKKLSELIHKSRYEKWQL
jgi:structural maintenance of chromosome 4